MKYRIAMWAAAGTLVAGGWAVYFFGAGKDHPIEPIVTTLARLTCPIAIVHYPVSDEERGRRSRRIFSRDKPLRIFRHQRRYCRWCYDRLLALGASGPKSYHRDEVKFKKE